MQSNNKKKICIVVSSLSDGGAEKSSAILSLMLNSLGHDIHVVTVLPKVTYRYAGTLFNLGEIKEKNDTILGRFRRFRLLKSYLKEHMFDFIIDNRSRNSLLREILVTKVLYNAQNCIYCVRSFNLNNYFVTPRFVSKFLYSDAYKVVAVSKAIQTKIETEFGLRNVTTIHNPVSIDQRVYPNPLNGLNYILFYGRIEDKVKNISLLIDAYAQSRLSENNYTLVIMGKGKDLPMLQQKVKLMQLTTVVFLDYDPNPEKYISNAKFVVLSSFYEGFPRVLIESLALGTPVISVDCDSGPAEIIQHEHNGLLVENHSPNQLANAMNRFIEDQPLYLRCKENAQSSIAKFSVTTIAEKWESLLHNL